MSFWLLARAVAARLRPEEQLELVAAVEDRLDNRNSDDPSRNNEARLLRRLAILRDVLGPPAREHYDELSAKSGFQPDHPGISRLYRRWMDWRNKSEESKRPCANDCQRNSRLPSRLEGFR